jgi:IclR family KDG regulon transcriptional repressor
MLGFRKRVISVDFGIRMSYPPCETLFRKVEPMKILHGPEAPPKSADSVQSVGRALNLLDVFLTHRSEVGLKELAASCGMNKATAHRLLKTLESRGYVKKSLEYQKYSLGVRVFELGALYQNQLNIRRSAMPEMTSLVEQTGQAAFLCIRDGDHALCLERVEGRHRARIYALGLGERQPLHCGAAPRALMSGMSDAEILAYASRTGLPAYTPHTITNGGDLLENVHRILADGYSISKEDVSVGVAAVGAPVRNHLGHVVASISVSGIASTYTAEKIADLADAIQSAACRLSYEIGYGTQERSLKTSAAPKRSIHAVH